MMWYQGSRSDSRRRSDVQALRATLDGITADGAVTIGLSGVGASSASVQELAADLSASIAASGRSVLLMDAVFDAPSDLYEYGGRPSDMFEHEYSNTGMDLADIIAPRATGGEAQEDLKLALGNRDLVHPELLSLRAGRLAADPVDAVAGSRFRELLVVAADFVEVVIVAAPPWGHPETDVLAQRLDHFLLVGRAGATTALEVEDAAAELAASRAGAVGLVLLRKRRLLGKRDRGRRSSQKRSMGQE
jgi:Mrp family chromosome partitioning ATPase